MDCVTKIIGIGIDIIEITRVQEALTKGGERFIQRVFTLNEQHYCRSRVNPAQHLAARFAAKEAILKALGTGWRGGIKWTDIDICAGTSGVPYPVLDGLTAEQARQRGIMRWHLSLTHSDSYAAAFVIAEGVGNENRNSG